MLVREQAPHAYSCLVEPPGPLKRVYLVIAKHSWVVPMMAEVAKDIFAVKTEVSSRFALIHIQQQQAWRISC
jgi:hypothetical protein